MNKDFNPVFKVKIVSYNKKYKGRIGKVVGTTTDKYGGVYLKVKMSDDRIIIPTEWEAVL